MFFISLLHKNWQRFLDRWHPDERKMLLEVLGQEYVDETRHAIQLREHARQMRYPQFRKKLLRIAVEEEEHGGWLREKILAMGGAIPQAAFIPTRGRNSWESLLMDLEAEKRCCADLVELINRVAAIDPEIAEGLRRIYDGEKTHRDEIR